MTKNDFGIDRDALDEEWLKQPQLMYEVCMAHADARRELNVLEAAHRVLTVRLKRKLRKTAIDAGDRFTEKELDERLHTIEAYVRSEEALTEQQYQVAAEAACVSAASDKRRALEALVELHKSHYHNSTPTERTSEDRKPGKVRVGERK